MWQDTLFWGSLEEGKATSLQFFHLSEMFLEWEQQRLQWG